jgi:hypothetical protein
MISLYLRLCLILFSIIYPFAVAQPCKNLPGSSDWPTPSEWFAFNQTLGGRLILPHAPAAACHRGQPEYNMATCVRIMDSWDSSQWHSDNPVSGDWQNWNNYSCLPDPSLPCSVDGYPTYVVNASTAKHVQQAVNFASSNNLRLNIKSTGHDFLGRLVELSSM